MTTSFPVHFAGQRVGTATTELGAVRVFKRLLSGTNCRPHGAVCVRVPHSENLEYIRAWHIDAWNSRECPDPNKALAIARERKEILSGLQKAA